MAIWSKDHPDYCPDCDRVGCQCIGGPETNLDEGIGLVHISEAEYAKLKQAEAELQLCKDMIEIVNHNLTKEQIENVELKKAILDIKLTMAGILAHGFGPHHTGAIREFLGYPTKEDLNRMILGKQQTGGQE